MVRLIAVVLLAAVVSPAHAQSGPMDDTFVADPNDPKKLYLKEGARERGLGREYFETMARPKLDPSVFDALERAGVPTIAHLPARAPSAPPLSPLLSTTSSGNVIVIEGTTDMVVQGENGLQFNQGQGLQEVIGRVWNFAGDNFDFITVFTTFNDNSTAAYYLPLQQDIQGLGECNMNAGNTFGCDFSYFDEGTTLQGFVFMNSIGYWQNWDYGYDGFVHDLDDLEGSVYAVLGQEVAHRWVAGLRFVDPRTGDVSKRLLGRDESHWAAWVDTQASVLDGWDWDSDSDGKFTLVDDMNHFSTLDLYAMGALPVAAAKPFFFIDDARFVPVSGFVGNQAIPADAVLQIPSVSLMADNDITLRATGEKVDLTIQNIVDAEGNRCPDPDHAQKTFRQAFVLLTQPGQSASSVQGVVDQLETVMASWETWWADRTNRALTLCTSLTAECVHPEASLGVSEIAIIDDAPFLEPGRAAMINVPASAKNDVVKNAVAHVVVKGNGGSAAVVAQTEIPIGDIAKDATVNVPIKLTVDASYPCGYSTIVEVSLTSDNAAPAVENYRVFPGYEELYAADFDDGDDYFKVNPDGRDSVTTGALTRVDVETSCTMTRRTPERDASPGGRGAFVTGEGDELDGLSSVWSPGVSLRDTIDPEIRFVYWLDGEPGDSLTVKLSEDGAYFVDAATITQSAHEWVVAVVRIRDVFDGKKPETVYARFEFSGHGHAEGGLDDVRILDIAGSCAQGLNACACSAAEGGAPGAPVAALVGTGVLAALLRRRRRA